MSIGKYRLGCKHNVLLRALCLCVFLSTIPLFSCFCQPAKLSFDNLGVKDGLPDDGAIDLLQDQQGYIWLATLNGLVRYDGYSYKIFRATVEDSLGQSPVGRSFVSLLLGKNGSIWASTLNSGFCQYDPHLEKFINFPNERNAKGEFEFPEHYLIQEDSKERVWFFGVNVPNQKATLRHYNPLNGQVSTLNISHKLGGKKVFDGFLVEDQAGQIWVHQKDSVLYKYNEDTGLFEAFSAVPFDDFSKNEKRSINHLMLDTAGILWVSTQQGLFSFNPKDNRWAKRNYFASTNKEPGHSIAYTYQDRRGTIWAYSQGVGLIRITTPSELPNIFSPKSEPLSYFGSDLSSFTVNPVMEDPAGIWFVNEKERLSVYPRKYLFYDFVKEEFVYYGEKFNNKDNIPNKIPYTYLIDQSGLIWIGNIGEGIMRQNVLAQKIDRIDLTVGDNHKTKNDTLFSIKEDRSQRIWALGKETFTQVEADGLSVTNYYPHGPGKPITFYTFFENEDGIFWVGSSLGLFEFNPRNERFSLVIPNLKQEASGIIPLQKDGKGNLWIGLLKNNLGMDRMYAVGPADLEEKKLLDLFTYSPEDSTSPPHPIIDNFLIDSKERIWIGTFGGGGARFNPDLNQFTRFQHQPEDSNSLSNNYISFLFEDSRSNIWIGTYNRGLNLYIEGPNTFKNWKDNHSFLNILTAVEDKERTLWFGTSRGEGLFRMDPISKELQYFNTADGLANDRVESIVEDHKGYLWIPSESGLSCFDPRTQHFTVFTEKDGFISYNDGEVPPFAKPFKANNGDIWMNTYTELVRIKPDKLLQKDSITPIVHIRSLKIGDSLYSAADGGLLEKHVFQTTSLSLAHDQNDLTFGFVGLHYARPEDNQYSYKLENFDTDWSEPSLDRKARYAGLPPGTYTFRVKASNADGVWNEEGAAIDIIIHKPWWLTAWALMGYVVLLGAAVYVFIRWRTHKHTQKILAQEKELERERELSEQLKVLDQLKDQFLANTSHELRTPLNGIIGLSEGVYGRSQAQVDKEDLELIITSGKRLHYLVDDLLDFSKLKKGDFELQQSAVDLKSVVSLIFRMSKSALNGKAVELKNEVPDSLAGVWADPHRLQQILYNLVGNAIKFTEQGSVSVAASQVGKSIKIEVKDTGTGIPKEQQTAIFEEFQQADGSISRKFGGTGLGLTITRQLVNLHGGEIGVESEVGQGSTFWFTLEAAKEVGETIGASDTELGTLLSIPNEKSLSFKQVDVEEASSPPIAMETGSGQRLRILIVDDEPINQRVIKNHLDDSRFDLTFADDGDEALEEIENSPMFDLVLLDVMMPNMSGYEVCKEIRAKYLASELPVIMVTAKNQVTDLVQGLNRGANDYLAKPFSKQEFLARVKTQLDLHQIFHITDRFIPNEFIRTLGHDRITDVQLGDLVERVVSVLFTDIRSYTTLSESMSPEDTFKFINGYTHRMGPIIHDNKGFVNQYLGDGIMAIFQYQADDALQAMIDMQIKLREYNGEREAKNRPEIRVGMGLHTGPLIMGIIGDSRRTDAATISDTVNTAARMEGLTKGFGVRILISGNSREALAHPEKYRFRYLGKVKVKGKNEAKAIYECIEGDPEEERALKWKLRGEFENGVRLYYTQYYQEAIDIFEKILQEHPLDKVSQYFHSKGLEGLG